MMFWTKFAYTLILAAAGAWAVKRIAYPLGSHPRQSRPDGRDDRGDDHSRPRATGDDTARRIYGHAEGPYGCCLHLQYRHAVAAACWSARFWVLRGLAPTRLTVAGAAAGLAAGAIASLRLFVPLQ